MRTITIGKKATRKVMKLVDASTGEMQCQVCGSVHWASLRHGGHYYRGSWQCVEGCRLEDREVTR